MAAASGLAVELLGGRSFSGHGTCAADKSSDVTVSDPVLYAASTGGVVVEPSQDNPEGVLYSLNSASSSSAQEDAPESPKSQTSLAGRVLMEASVLR